MKRKNNNFTCYGSQQSRLYRLRSAGGTTPGDEKSDSTVVGNGAVTKNRQHVVEVAPLASTPIGGWHGTTKRGWGVQPLAPGRPCARCGRCETYCEMIEARNPGRFHTTLASRGG